MDQVAEPCQHRAFPSHEWTMADSKHRNDIYGDNPESGEAPPIPAATVVLLRMQGELEVLMLHKTSQIAFGGMWVFPGGRIDPEDYPADGDMDTAARNAAVRETREEAGIESGAGDFVFLRTGHRPRECPSGSPPGSLRRRPTAMRCASMAARSRITSG